MNNATVEFAKSYIASLRRKALKAQSHKDRKMTLLNLQEAEDAYDKMLTPSYEEAFV